MQAAQPQSPPAPALSFPKLGMLTGERWLVGSHIAVALLALLIGILLGPFQTFRRAPMLQWDIPVFSYYYQALTVHGVMNALIFTTFFIVGFSYFVTQRSLQRSLRWPKLAWVAFGLMFAGLAMVLWAIWTGQANVLYTFYPSLVAHPAFYFGLVLLVVGTWIVAANTFATYFGWRREHAGERVPLAVFAIMANYVMWCVATIGVAIEVLFMLLPLSLGWITTTDPQLARALFWFFGHPLVYFWLIPAYVSWYTMLPKQTNSRLFSDPLGRVAFLMLMIFSVPVGVHHMFSDPGVSNTMKGIHTVFTFIVAVPSFLTAFNIGAVLELAARRRGARGPFGWLIRQDWGNPVVAAQITGMILFIAGGFSGLIHASFTLNIALHNTSWVPAHFHMTLAGAVLLTFISILYWLVPLLRGRALWSRRVALWQVYTWLGGMLIFGHSMGTAGILGMPRRTDLSGSPYVSEAAAFWLNTSAIGGMVLMVATVFLALLVTGGVIYAVGQTIGPEDHE